MMTLGDIWQNTRQFFTLTPSNFKRPSILKEIPNNPIKEDTPSLGRIYRNYNDEQKQRMALQTAYVYEAINKIAMATQQAQLNIKRRDGEEVENIYNHPLEVIYRQPNTELSTQYVMMHTIFSLSLDCAYWFLYPDTQGNIAEIWPIPFTKIEPIAGNSPEGKRFFPDATDRLIAGYVYRPQTGKELKLPADCVVHFRYPDPFDPYGSLPPLKAANRAVFLDNAQTLWNGRFFDKDNGMPRSVISLPAELDQPTFNEAKRQLKEHHGKNMIVRAGAINVDVVQQTLQEMQFTDVREQNKEDIFGVFGVPLEDDKEAQRNFIANTVWPILQLIAGQFTVQVVNPYFGDDIFAEFEDIRPQDRSLAVQESVQYAPFRSLNEERGSRDEPPLPSLIIPDNVPMFGGMSLYDDVPNNLVRNVLEITFSGGFNTQSFNVSDDGGFAGQPSMPGSAGAEADQVRDDQQANPEMVEAEAETEVTQPEDGTKAFDLAMNKWRDLALGRSAKGRSIAVYLDDAIPEEASYKIAFTLGLCQSAKEIKAVFGHLDHYLDDDHSHSHKMTLEGDDQTPPEAMADEAAFSDAEQAFLEEQQKRIEREIALNNNQLPDQAFWANEVELAKSFFGPYLVDWTENSISRQAELLAEVGLGIDADVNARASAWAADYAADMARGITGTTRELVKAKFKTWTISDGDFEALIESLSKVISPRWRAELIASTEVTRAYAVAVDEIEKELGDIAKGQMWTTVRDELVCPICGPLHDKRKNRNTGKFPGGFDNPPAHPRCRCYKRIVV